MKAMIKGNFLDVREFVSKKNGKSYKFIGFYSSDGDTVQMFCPDALVDSFRKHKKFDEINVICRIGFDTERQQIKYSLLDLVE